MSQAGMHELCEKLYTQKLPAQVVNNDVLIALNPSDGSTFYIQRRDKVFTVRRLPSGKQEYLSPIRSDESSGRHAQRLPGEWLHSLSKAFPVPINQVWGTRWLGGRIAEVVLFMLDQSKRPSYHYCAISKTDNQLVPLFRRQPIDIEKFWVYVRRGQLYDVACQFRHAKYYKVGTNDVCVVLNGEILAPHDAWRYYGIIHPGDLYGESNLSSKMGW